MRDRFVKATLIVLGVAALTFGASKAFAQSTASLDFGYSGQSGKLVIENTYDDRLPRGENCVVRVRGGLSYEGETTAESLRTLLKLKIKRRSSFRVVVRRNQAAKTRASDSALPILTLQTRTTCRKSNIDIISNAAARYVICGKGSDSLAPRTYLRVLAKNVKDSVN